MSRSGQAQSVHRTHTGGAPSSHLQESEFARWGGMAGLGGVAMLVGAAVAVAIGGLPDASDAETLYDFADIKTGRVVEHLFYLAAVMMFALHAYVLHKLLTPVHRAAAGFAGLIAGFGFVIMAASSLLHVSTAPLSDLYDEASSADQEAIEYAWHGAQSVFDTMLATGVLLVPIAMVFFGIAMRWTVHFGARFAAAAVALGLIGTAGALVTIIDPASQASALTVIAIAVFHLVTGWRTLTVSGEAVIDVTASDMTETESA